MEILREAGSAGLHVDTIAKRCDLHSGKLGTFVLLVFSPSFKHDVSFSIAHILRLLATHHILVEVSPDVFANNRISALVDSGKTIEEIIKKFVSCPALPYIRVSDVPSSEDKKYEDTNGIAAFVGLWSVITVFIRQSDPVYVLCF